MPLPKEYTIYFRFMGKKMRKSYIAESAEEAKEKFRKELIIDAVKCLPSEINNIADALGKAFNL